MSEESDQPQDQKTTLQLDPDEVEALRGVPEFADQEDFLETQEMDSMSRAGNAHPSLETTQRYDVPDDLLQMAMRSQEMAVLPETSEDEYDWREFVAIVDPRGRIVLPSRVQQELRGKKLRVKYIVDD